MGDRDRGGGRGERAAREGSRATSPLRRALGRRVLERLLKGGGRRGGLGWVSTWLAGFSKKYRRGSLSVVALGSRSFGRVRTLPPPLTIALAHAPTWLPTTLTPIIV